MRGLDETIENILAACHSPYFSPAFCTQTENDGSLSFSLSLSLFHFIFSYLIRYNVISQSKFLVEQRLTCDSIFEAMLQTCVTWSKLKYDFVKIVRVEEIGRVVEPFNDNTNIIIAWKFIRDIVST